MQGVGAVVVVSVVVVVVVGGGDGGGLAPFCKPPLEQAGTFVSSRERQMVVRGRIAAKAIVVADLRATWSTLLSSQLVETSFYRFHLRAGPNLGWYSESATRYAPLIT